MLLTIPVHWGKSSDFRNVPRFFFSCFHFELYFICISVFNKSQLIINIWKNKIVETELDLVYFYDALPVDIQRSIG